MRNRGPSRFDKAAVMTEREKARFKLMYEHPGTYSKKDISMSFGIADASIARVAKDLGLKVRSSKGTSR